MIEEMFIVDQKIDGKNVKLMYVETWDGLYTAVGLRIPNGNGPFPLVLFSYGNGGEGMPWIIKAFENKAYTIIILLKPDLHALGFVIELKSN